MSFRTHFPQSMMPTLSTLPAQPALPVMPALLLLVFALSPPAFAQGATSTGPTVLDLDSVMRLAADQAPDSQVAAAQVQVAMAQTDRARSALYPTVGFSTSVSPGAQMTVPLLSKDEEGLCTAGNISCSVGSLPVGSARAAAGVDLRWRLFDFGATQAAIDARRHAETASQARAQGTTAQVVALAVRRYLQVVADDELITVRARLAADRARQADVVKARAELGEGAPSDVLQAQVAADAAALDLDAARAQRSADRAALQVALGLTPDVPVEVQGDLHLELGAGFDERGNADPRQHPDVVAATADVDAAHDDVVRAERAFFPTIDGSASVGANLVAITKPDANLTPSAGLGVSLSWPWLDLGRNADVSLANASRVVVERQRDARVLAIQSARAQALVNLDAQGALVARATRLRESAQQAVTVVEGLVAAGAGRLAELLDAQAALTQAEATLVQARASRALAVVDVALASGVVDAGSLVRPAG